MNTRSFEIVGGPSRDALFDACKYAYDSRSTIVVDFEVAIGYTAPPSQPGAGYIPMKLKGIKIVGIQHEDGSGAGFRIHGYCDADLNLRDYKYSATWQHYKFRASYDTKHRTGEFTFIL